MTATLAEPPATPRPIASPTAFTPSIQPGVTLGADVARFLGSPRRLLIDGEWVPAASGRTFETYNPATGGALAREAEADAEDVDRAITTIRRSW